MNEGERGIIAWKDWHVVVWNRYKLSWFDRNIRFSIPTAIVLFILAAIANTVASAYANEKASNFVTDIILSNTRAYDVDHFFVYGMILLIAVITLLCLLHPKRIPFTLHALSLFMFIRAVFVSLTHLGPYPIQATLDFQSKIILTLFGGGDQFFSGHTGAPFLMALIFWHQKPLRYLFLAWSLFFAVIVLLGHFHYTIDVLSAFFITYTIYHLTLYLFPKERALFMDDTPKD